MTEGNHVRLHLPTRHPRAAASSPPPSSSSSRPSSASPASASSARPPTWRSSQPRRRSPSRSCATPTRASSRATASSTSRCSSSDQAGVRRERGRGHGRHEGVRRRLRRSSPAAPGRPRCAQEGRPAGGADAAHPERARTGARAGEASVTPLSPEAEKIIDGVEALIEQADELNDALVTDEQKVTDRIAADAAATAARGKRLVVIVLALAFLLAAFVSLVMAQPAGPGLAPPAGGRPRHLRRATSTRTSTSRSPASSAPPPSAFGDMVAYLREMERAANGSPTAT